MTEKISKTERKNVLKIYDVIRDNSRMTFSSIAKKTKLTRQTVTKLFEKMEKNNLIWGYCAVVNAKKFGYNTYALLVKTKSSAKVDFKTFQDFCLEKERMKKDGMKPYIVYCGFFHGEYDWIVLFLAKDLITARKNVNELISGYQNYIEDFLLEEELVPIRIVGFVNPNASESLEKLV